MQQNGSKTAIDKELRGKMLAYRGFGVMLSGPRLSSGTVGAIAEYLVSIDLLKRGFEVFRAVSPHCSCDLTILKGNCCVRVEVKSTYQSKTNADILAVCNGRTGAIEYFNAHIPIKLFRQLQTSLRAHQ